MQKSKMKGEEWPKYKHILRRSTAAEAKENNMSLTRKLLESMGLESDKVSTIIEAHAETVDGLKAKIEEYKLNAEKVPTLQKELDGLTKELEKLKSNGGDWEAKYSKEHEAFEEFKKAQTEKEEKVAKEKAYKTLLKEAGVNESVFDEIIGVTDFKDIKLSEDGFENKDNIVEGIKTKWKGFITKTSVEGAKTSTPIKNDGGTKLTKEDIYKKDDKGRYVLSTAERQKAIMENSEAFAQ